MSEKVIPQEPDRLRGRVIVAIGVAAVLAGVAAVASEAGMLSTEKRPLPVPAASTLPREIGSGTPIDTTMVDKTDFGIRLRERQLKELGEYGWVDRQKGIARIPIDKAMDMIAKESAK